MRIYTDAMARQVAIPVRIYQFTHLYSTRPKSTDITENGSRYDSIDRLLALREALIEGKPRLGVSA